MKLRILLLLCMASTLVAADNSVVVVQRPATATSYIESSRAHFGVWTNPRLWKLDPHPTDMFMLEFKHVHLHMEAILNAEAAVVPVESLAQRALENGRAGSTKLDIVSQEHRTVCGKDVLFLVMEGMDQTPFTLYGYYYSGPEGTVQCVVSVYTAEPKAGQELALDFLNGLQIGQSSGAPPAPDKTAVRAQAGANAALAIFSNAPAVSGVVGADIETLNASVPYAWRDTVVTAIQEFLADDPAKVVKRLQPLADKKDPLARCLLGIYYASGKGVPADAKRAVSLMKQAVAAGLPLAQAVLGSWYANGYQVPRDWKEAERLFSQAAAAGSVDGQERLGEILLASDPQRAVELLRKAAERKYSVAEYRLALCYASGMGVEKNTELQLTWLQRASEHGSISATESLGDFYWIRNTDQDRVEAVKYFAKAAKAGSARSQNNLAVCLRYGTYIPRDLPQSAQWLQKAAEQGMVDAETNLGKTYAYGYGIARDPKLARYWLEKAANQGGAEAQLWMGTAYADGRDMEKNVQAGLALLHKAAEQNSPKACWDLAVIYLIRKEVPQGEAEGMKWLRKGAEVGDPHCQEELSRHYFSGDRVEKDEGEGMKWLRKAAVAGAASAQYSLGYFYMVGEGVPKNARKGTEWYRKAAEQGYANAQFNLGIAYSTGDGVEINQEEKARWFRLAAIQGNAAGQNAYGYALATGLGVKQDLVEAYKWYLLAMAQNDADPKARAGVNARAITPQMAPEQIEEAKRRAAAFVPEIHQLDEPDTFTVHAA